MKKNNLTLVFIHGLGLGGWVFEEKLLKYLSDMDVDIHNIGLPGHKENCSVAERAVISLEDCRRYSTRYISNNITTPIVLIGMSMGGAVCQRIIERDGNDLRVKGIVLLSSVPPKNNLLFTLKLCKKLALTNPSALVDFFACRNNSELMYSDSSVEKMSDSELIDYSRKIKKGFSRLEYEIFFQDVVKSSIYEMNVPVKVIAGEQDALFPPEVARFIGSFYDAEVDILPGLGHMIPLEPECKSSAESIKKFVMEILDELH